jgi:hypothetical protein
LLLFFDVVIRYQFTITVSKIDDRRFLRDLGVEPGDIRASGIGRRLVARKGRLAVVLLVGLISAYAAWGLSQPRAMIHVNVEPLGALVVVNEWFRGDAPFSQELPAGRHRVVVRMPGHREERLVVEVSSGEIRQVSVRLKRRGGALPEPESAGGMS